MGQHPRCVSGCPLGLGSADIRQHLALFPRTGSTTEFRSRGQTFRHETALAAATVVAEDAPLLVGLER
jgi:hypothetical protein